jgi:hypothetical protein
VAALAHGGNQLQSPFGHLQKGKRNVEFLRGGDDAANNVTAPTNFSRSSRRREPRIAFGKAETAVADRPLKRTGWSLIAMRVIYLERHRALAERPDPCFAACDEDGRDFFKYALQYELDGKIWAADIWAYSFDDAERRVHAMRNSVAVLGQLHSEVVCENLPSNL